MAARGDVVVVRIIIKVVKTKVFVVGVGIEHVDGNALAVIGLSVLLEYLFGGGDHLSHIGVRGGMRVDDVVIKLAVFDAEGNRSRLDVGGVLLHRGNRHGIAANSDWVEAFHVVSPLYLLSGAPAPPRTHGPRRPVPTIALSF